MAGHRQQAPTVADLSSSTVARRLDPVLDIGSKTLLSRPRRVWDVLEPSILFILGDVVALCLASSLAIALRHVLWGPMPYPAGLFQVAAGWILLRLAAQLYPGYGVAAPEELRLSTVTTAMAGIGHAAVLFAAKETGVSRLVAGVTWGLLILLSWVIRMAIKEQLIRFDRFGAPIIVVGAGRAAALVVRELKRNRELGLNPVAVFDHDRSRDGGRIEGIPIVGGVDDAVHGEVPWPVQHAIIAMPEAGGRQVVELASLLATRYPRVGIVPDLFGLSNLWLRSRSLGICLTLEVPNNLLSPLARWTKRVADLSLAVPSAILAVPAVLAAALTVKIASPGPAFFAQEREGVSGRRIRVWKIRTMRPDAEVYLDAYLRANSGARHEWESHMKLRRDPRVIPVVGRFLRRFSIDELPQLWSVIRGEMSLVGPRPFPDYHLGRFSSEFRDLRRQVPPGITGLWQVACRSEGDLDLQEETDSYYIRNWSLWVDLWVLLRTVRVVLNGAGSY